MTAEQKAEEIANKRCHEIMCFGHCNFSSPKHHRCGEWHREYNCALDGYHEGFKNCAKARLNVTTISDCSIKDDWHKQEIEDIYDLIAEDWSIKYFICIMKDKSRVTAIGNCDEGCNGEVSVNLFFDHDDEKYHPDDIVWWKEIVLPKESE